MNKKVDRWNMIIDSNGEYDPPSVYPLMSEDGEWVEYSDYEKLLTKYNGVFKWVSNNMYDLPFDTEDIKTYYEGA